MYEFYMHTNTFVNDAMNTAGIKSNARFTSLPTVVLNTALLILVLVFSFTIIPFIAHVARMYRFCLVCVSVCPSVRLSVRARVSVRGFLPPCVPIPPAYPNPPYPYSSPHWWRAVRSSLELILVYCHFSDRLLTCVSLLLLPCIVIYSSIHPVSYTHLRSPRDRQKSRMPSSA